MLRETQYLGLILFFAVAATDRPLYLANFEFTWNTVVLRDTFANTSSIVGLAKNKLIVCTHRMKYFRNKMYFSALEPFGVFASTS